MVIITDTWKMHNISNNEKLSPQVCGMPLQCPTKE